MKSKKEAYVTFRVSEEIKEAFEGIAEEHELTVSQMLRSFMRKTVEQELGRIPEVFSNVQAKKDNEQTKVKKKNPWGNVLKG